MGDMDVVETLLAVSEHLEQFDEWQENERQLGVVCRMAADEIIQLREQLRTGYTVEVFDVEDLAS